MMLSACEGRTLTSMVGAVVSTLLDRAAGDRTRVTRPVGTRASKDVAAAGLTTLLVIGAEHRSRCTRLGPFGP